MLFADEDVPPKRAFFFTAKCAMMHSRKNIEKAKTPMKLGIIGKAGCGKTTVFEALTGQPDDPAQKGENRIGTVTVPDNRVDRLSEIYRPAKTIHAQVAYFLPGLKTRADGRRQDQSYWAGVRESDALIHVVRNFEAFGVEQPRPAHERRALDQELILADLMVVEKRLERLANDNRRGKKYNPEEFDLLQACRRHLEDEAPIRQFPDLACAPLLRGYALLSAKPVLLLSNNGDDDDALPDLGPVPENDRCLVIKGKLEQELAQMSAAEAADFLSEFGITAAARDRVIRHSYQLLGLISFFTVGEDEVRAWTIAADTSALEAAGVIHTDLMQGFIRAEVIATDDLMAAGSMAEARKKGSLRLEGKTYPVQDGDILTVRFNI